MNLGFIQRSLSDLSAPASNQIALLRDRYGSSQPNESGSGFDLIDNVLEDLVAVWTNLKGDGPSSLPSTYALESSLMFLLLGPKRLLNFDSISDSDEWERLRKMAHNALIEINKTADI